MSASRYVLPVDADSEGARVEEPATADALDREPAYVPSTAVGPSPPQSSWSGEGGEKAKDTKEGHGAGSRLLTLRIRETDQPTDDRLLLDEVKQVLLEHRGEDAVRLEIASNGVHRHAGLAGGRGQRLSKARGRTPTRSGLLGRAYGRNESALRELAAAASWADVW